MLAKDPDLIIEMDASIQGWGAVCKDVCTRGLWLQEEQENHISYLELLAAMFAVKVLTKDQEDTHAHLCMDKRTSVFYVKCIEGICSPTMNRLAIPVVPEEKPISIRYQG